MSEALKLIFWGGLCAVALGAAINGGMYWAETRNYGWKFENNAPWCQVVQPEKELLCEFFSEEHCEHTGRMGGKYGPTEDPLCVKNPRS